MPTLRTTWSASYRGTGKIKWQTAMAAIFIEGLVFMVLAVTGVRTKIAKAIPKSVQIATTGGIGMFLAHLGLQTAEGIGLVVTDVATGVTLGGCAPEYRTYATYNGLTADAYTCDNLGHTMESATTWLGIFTVVLIALLLKRKVIGAVIIGTTASPRSNRYPSSPRMDRRRRRRKISRWWCSFETGAGRVGDSRRRCARSRTPSRRGSTSRR